MKRVIVVIAVLIAVIAAIVAVLEIGDPDVQTEAALPGIQGPGSALEPPPCAHLEGRARDECRLAVRAQLIERREAPATTQ
jgi:hypothetical protein